MCFCWVLFWVLLSELFDVLRFVFLGFRLLECIVCFLVLSMIWMSRWRFCDGCMRFVLICWWWVLGCLSKSCGCMSIIMSFWLRWFCVWVLLLIFLWGKNNRFLCGCVVLVLSGCIGLLVSFVVCFCVMLKMCWCFFVLFFVSCDGFSFVVVC